MRRFAAATGLLALALLLLVSSARRATGVRAGTAVRMDVSGLVQNSNLIVEARVLSSKALESDGRIETEYLLFVERTFEGEDHSLRSLRMPGGVLPDGRGMVLAGMPMLETGEMVLLFLSDRGETGIRVPVGLAQGKYRVTYAEDGQKLLERSITGLSLVNGQTGEEVPGTSKQVRMYASVVAQIEAALVLKRAEEARQAAESRSADEKEAR